MAEDRELLELAAKAAGYTPDGICGSGILVVTGVGTAHQKAWAFDSLTNNGDALELAVKTEADIYIRAGRWTEVVCPMGPAVKVEHGGDPLAATRRAITRAAAEIGRKSNG